MGGIRVRQAYVRSPGICYVRLEDLENTHSFGDEIDRAVHKLKPERGFAAIAE